MKRYRTLFVTISIVAVCTLGLTLVSNAQSNAQSNPRQNLRQNLRQMPGMQPDTDQAPRGNRPDFQPGRNMGLGLNLAGVELSDAQQEQVQQQMRDFQVSTAEIRQKLQFAEQDARREMRNETVDQAKIDGLWADIASLKQQLGQAQMNHILALKGILTPEQLATIQAAETAALELQKLRLEERELLLASGAPNEERLQQIQAEIAEKEVALERERFEHVAERAAERIANMPPEEQDRFRNNRGRDKQMQPRR